MALGAGSAEAPAAEQLAVITDERIAESSGMAFAHVHPDAVWIHNDSGDSARFFLVGFDGAVLREYAVPGEAAFDWEDMCAFTAAGTRWLLIGDVGDNARNRRLTRSEGVPLPPCRLLLIREPAPGTEAVGAAPLHGAILFEFEDGSHNCESLAVDTERGEILLVTKSKSNPLDCGFYSLPLTLESGESTATARRLGDLDIPQATAMDISADNRRMVILAHSGARIFERREGESWGDAIRRRPRIVAMPQRRNGETVCFTKDRDELILNSEFTGQPIWRVRLR